ncbi:hypothetical protein D9619_003671 [Psilocybe cf. subviscida]|uniref:O-methyltransferase C-terminal domain-containing protein n=1 Tax=Psilocybe cf. subviscida TaxID=2480587 RepID=A0A8H5AY34_9AGAR|nr:hypothetical protein D9619_003671 [Psilocybe cf. subviscida]
MLDTGKSVNEILANPDKKYDNTSGYAALAGHQLDEVPKASAYLWENLSDPAVAHLVEVNKTTLNRAFNWDGPMWTFFDQPEQKARQHRFDIAMQGAAAFDPDTILMAFDWTSLPTDSVVVDVGGGVGTASLVLAKNIPNVRIVIQDLPSVVKDGQLFWKEELPEAIDSGRVVLEAHDFFAPQPVANASVFFLKHILHNWPNAYASKILMRLREVAKNDTKLILIESLMPFACHDPSGDNGSGVPGAVPKEAPKPLLANYGIANEFVYNADLSMLVLFNSQERTVKHLEGLLQKTGWRMTKVVRDSARGVFHPVEAVPIF